MFNIMPSQSNKIKIKSNNEYEVNLEELLEAKNEVILKLLLVLYTKKKPRLFEKKCCYRIIKQSIANTFNFVNLYSNSSDF